MSDFMELVKKEQAEQNNVSYTENGALGYRSTGKALLNLNFAVSSLRSTPNCDVVAKFMEAFHEDNELAMKWLFFARDIRQGMGEKRLWKVCMNFLARNYANDIRHLITPKIMGEYGCWKDITIFFGTPLEVDALVCIKEQLREDKNNMEENKPISLLAKWIPSVNTTSDETRKMARTICRHLNMRPKDYRKMIAKMRRYIKVIEVQMTANDWGKIEYEHVPSIANMRYADAFMRHDSDRRHEFLTSLSKGEAKINSKDLYPYQITHKMYDFYKHVYYRYYRETYDDDCILSTKGVFLKRGFTEDPDFKEFWKEFNMDMLNGMWNNLPNLVPENANVLVVRDGSGSMSSNGLPVGDVTAFDVANSLTMYFAEKLPAPWKNKFITFSSEPEIVTLPTVLTDGQGNNIPATPFDKYRSMLFHNDMTNTNIEKVFDLILSTAVNNELKQEELPGSILIVSDMEFDDATTSFPGRTLFGTIEKKFTDRGYKMPRLVFWNVCSRTNTIPVKENELGVTLVSGFSIQIMNMVMSTKTDPFEVLLETLMSDRYKPITLNKG